VNELSRTETRELAECEAVIQRGLATFIEVGSALLKIRDDRLYREKFATFEHYCRERWKMTDRRARQLCAAAEIAGNIGTGTTVPKPDSESQARPLSRLASDQQRDAWKKATEEYGQPTAAQVKATVDEMFPRHAPQNGQGKLFENEPPEPPEPIKGRSFENWEAFIQRLNNQAVWIQEHGDIDGYTSGWNAKQLTFIRENLKRFRDDFSRWLLQLEGNPHE
jgi:hypothetical protein